jgi:putative tryptophan/tyrosine transport system substrate-binding protein
MNRREIVAGLASATAWPVVTWAQQGDRMRRIGVLTVFDETDPAGKGQLSGFTQGLAELGWREGRNLRIDIRWAAANMRMFAKELVHLHPDVILAHATPAIAALQPETTTIPIVFVAVADPVGAGFVESLSRPGRNITGFANLEGTMAGKWLQLLTEIAPAVKRVAVMFNPDMAPGRGSFYLTSFEAAARLLNVEPIVTPIHSDAEIETVITSLGREPGGGIVVVPDGGFTVFHREPIILLAARNNVPAVYNGDSYVRDGGLLSYGPSRMDIFRRSADEVIE